MCDLSPFPCGWAQGGAATAGASRGGAFARRCAAVWQVCRVHLPRARGPAGSRPRASNLSLTFKPIMRFVRWVRQEAEFVQVTLAKDSGMMFKHTNYSIFSKVGGG